MRHGIASQYRPAPARRPRFQILNPVRRPGFRGDIEGLRAIAVLLVLLGHAGVPFLAGGFVGVDVFFVISGYLITGRIRDEIQARGKFSLKHFYAARIERLLPAAAVTLYAVLILMLAFLPKARWRETSFDVLASATYVVNWRLTDRAADYFARSTPPSPVQHFWSLSVEEQFYLIWPLLFLAVLGLARLRKWSLTRIWRPLLVALAGLAVVSFAWAAYLTSVSASTAYFRTGTRLWELALGAGLALTIAKLPSISSGLAAALGWVGILAIGVSAVLFDEYSRFPGAAALLPTVATVLLLIAGASGTHGNPVAGFLNSNPMRAIGALSYSLYLWHWPLLILAAAILGDLPLWAALAVTLFSAVPAYLSFRLVERPIRRRGWLRRSPYNAFVVTVASAMMTIAPAFLIGSSSGKPVPRAQASLDDIRNGAAVLAVDPRGDARGAPVDKVDSIVPDPQSAASDLPDVDRDGCFAVPSATAPKVCEYGDPASRTKIVLVGDSHAVQWVPGLRAVAEAKRWHLIVYGKSACPFVDGLIAQHDPHDEPYPECTVWNKAVRTEILARKPTLVITTNVRFGLIESGKPLIGKANQDARIASMRASWSNLTDAGIPVVVIRDSPLPPFNVADCVSGHQERLTKCAFDRERAVAGIGEDQVTAARGLKDVQVLDFNDAICPTDMCAPVIGGVLVYRDGDHLTATYALSLAPRMLAVLEPIVPT